MNDKKKMIIVIALGVVVLGVGAFQFTQMSSGDAKPQALAKREVKSEPDAGTGETAPPNFAELYKLGSPRDPFTPGALEQLPDSTPPTTQKEPTPVPGTRRPGSGINKIPAPDWGENPPWNRNGNDPVIPNVGGNNGNGGPNVTPAVDPNAFRYTVTGVISGVKPAAVFTDPAGNQRLVPLGGSPGEGSQLVAVERGRVTVKHNGKTLTFNVGGTPNVK